MIRKRDRIIRIREKSWTRGMEASQGQAPTLPEDTTPQKKNQETG
jgi:hypothetical protein